MGLLENVARRASKLGLGPRVVAALPFVSLLTFFAGIAWLLVLPMDGQFRNTYVSENALLPHQAATHFRESEWHILRGYRETVREVVDEIEPRRNARLGAVLEGMALKTATHEWAVAEGLEASQFGEDDGENLYAILHAPRGSHNEAIVIVAPWLNEEGLFNDGGVALLIALAKYFRRWSVWHKNIIFVIPSNSHAALRAWVEAYHTTLKYTAGSIEGVVVLDYPWTSEFFDHIDIGFDGLNGQQPNLDLINTIVRVADSEGVRTEILDMGASYFQYDKRLRVMLKGIVRQVFAGLWPGPGSEMFSGWRIDAVTIRARGSEGGHDITTFGRVVESTVRSINNLLEHFHQSFFFYLLLGPKQFVSIGTYLPSAALAANSYPLMALYTLIKSQPFSTDDLVPALGVTFALYAMSVLVGQFMSWMPLYTLMCALAYATLVSQAVLLDPVLSLTAKRIVHSLALILFGLSVTVLATINFSQALVLAIAAYPLVWVRSGNPLNALLLLASSPLVGLIALAYYVDKPLVAVFQQLVLGNTHLHVWAFPVVNAIWTPLWLASLLLATSVPYELHGGRAKNKRDIRAEAAYANKQIEKEQQERELRENELRKRGDTASQ